MAEWVTHLMIADQILKKVPSLDRRGYCVGNIAPDCNVENENWAAFTPPREVTHWMESRRKTAADCDRFLEEYLLPHMQKTDSHEEASFLLGYYTHLIADAEFQRYLRDEARVRSAWERLCADKKLAALSAGMPETWDSFKLLIPKEERLREIAAIETRYLADHPSSGYLTEILPLTSFPDYIDYLPPGSIVRKIRIMGKLPSQSEGGLRFLAMSREEYAIYVQNTVSLVLDSLKTHHLIP